MAGFHTQVSLHGFPFEDSQLTVKLAAGITAADVGKALTQDTSADNQMKLAGDGDPIDGQLLTVENRSIEGQLVGTCSFRFAAKLPVKSGLAGAAVVARGSRLIGAGAGEVKAIDLSGSPTAATIAAYAAAPRAWAVAAGKVVATKIA